MRPIIFLTLAVLAGVASAQPGLVSTQLERRVSDELATEGTVLSRNGWSLRVEPIDDRLRVSIIDAVTGRVLASTTLDRVPLDREAAVATITPLAADLVAQIAEGAAPQADSEEHREIAKLSYERDAIRFGNELVLLRGDGARPGPWVAYRGELDHRLDPKEFYTLVGRPDLADEYQHRRDLGIDSAVLSAALLVPTFVLAWKASEGNGGACSSTAVGSLSSPPTANQVIAYNACIDAQQAAALDTPDHHRAYTIGALAFAGADLLSFGVALWYWEHPHPISEDQAKYLADEYNHGLRRRLGLPVVSRREPRVRDVRIAPYASSGGGGLVLDARF